MLFGDYSTSETRTIRHKRCYDHSGDEYNVQAHVYLTSPPGGWDKCLRLSTTGKRLQGTQSA